MNRIRLASLCAVALGVATVALAADKQIGVKKLMIKDNADTTKRQIQIQSGDEGILYTDANSPGTLGASVHLWSASQEFCYILTADAEAWTDSGKGWKYKNKATKNQAQ